MQMQLTSPYWLEELGNGYAAAGPIKRLTVALFAIVAVVMSIMSAPGAIGLLGALLALVMLAIAVIDGRSFVIPNALTGAGFALALLHAAIAREEPDGLLASVGYAVVRGVVLAVIFLALRSAYQQIRGSEGIGLGDVKLAGVAGAWLDWTFMPIAVEITACVALIVYLARHFLLQRPVHATSRLPFGLFFAPSIWLCWVFETTLVASF